MYLALIQAGLLVSSAAASSATKADAHKPACNAQILGRMWPDAANDNPRLVVQLTRAGELEICTRGPWRYSWKSPTVSLEKLRTSRNRPER
jgi:hypothetical protein